MTSEEIKAEISAIVAKTNTADCAALVAWLRWTFEDDADAEAQTLAELKFRQRAGIPLEDGWYQAYGGGDPEDTRWPE